MLPEANERPSHHVWETIHRLSRIKALEGAMRKRIRTVRKTFRLSEAQWEELEMVSQALERPAAEVVREALTEYIQAIISHSGM
jgi:DNA-binding PadR family transcriptional regulator